MKRSWIRFAWNSHIFPVFNIMKRAWSSNHDNDINIITTTAAVVTSTNGSNTLNRVIETIRLPIGDKEVLVCCRLKPGDGGFALLCDNYTEALIELRVS